jgi:alpha-glucan,water dikinase
MDVEEERVVDYSTDKKLLGSAQDIEGVIKDGELYIVQTRPQM